jgi:type I restriction enzyme R subunit
LGAGEPRDRERTFLSELTERLNELFGAEITEDDKVMFAVHISEKLRANDSVMAQVRNNSREQALKADLPDAATDAIVAALESHEKMATRLLKDNSAMETFLGLLYDLLRHSRTENLIYPTRE